MSAHQEDVAERRHQDLIDIIMSATRTPVRRKLPDNTYETEYQDNHEALWWKTQVVSSEQFGRLALELKEFQRLGKQAYSNMSYERAEAIEAEINGIVESYMRSIDAKSSESTRGDNAVTSTLIDRINKSNVEKTLHLEGKDKGIMAKMFGREEDQAYE